MLLARPLRDEVDALRERVDLLLAAGSTLTLEEMADLSQWLRALARELRPEPAIVLQFPRRCMAPCDTQNDGAA
jgi:hypothetical protein